MAGTFITTSTYSNITRLELEQLRRGDFTAGGKALTVGDSAYLAENVVGKGNVNAEPFYTGPAVNLDDVYAITPPKQPGPGLLTTTTPGALVSEYARWFGPYFMWDSAASGFASAAGTWTDNTLVTSFIALGILPGDILLIKPTDTTYTDQNVNVVGTVQTVAANSLTISNIYNPNTTGTAFQFGGGTLYNYMIVRPNATQLFAVPGSGPLGEEQTFMMVDPGAPIHTALSPTTDDINVFRIRDIVRPNAALNATVDRSDFVFNLGAPRTALKASLDKLGYRIVLYPSLPPGDPFFPGPDLTKPITTLNPVIDPAIPAADQRMTIDYKAGTVRFSCAPKVGGDILIAGGVSTVGRLNLYAVFWAIDTSLTTGNARGLYSPRSDELRARPAGRVRFDNLSAMGFLVGSTTDGNDAFIRALGGPEAKVSTATSYPFVQPWQRSSTEFGTFEVTAGSGQRYFSYRQGENQWRFLAQQAVFWADFGYGDGEMFVADKTEFTVSDAGGPANAAANLNPIGALGSTYGIRSHFAAGLMTSLHTQLARTPYGTVHLKKGRYYVERQIPVPPGTTIEGEGAGTKIIFRNTNITGLESTLSRSVFKVGPNTTWGVYDATAYYDDVALYKTAIQPTLFSLLETTRIEGMDTVWNPVRRCWGIVFADATANGIFFNEVLEDGTRRFPGLGVNIKDNANLLFLGGAGHQNHSGGHYPRIAYQEFANEYCVVWVEEVTSGFTGGQVTARWFQLLPDSTQTTASGWTFYYPYPTLHITSDYTFSDHPSVAVENWMAYPTQYTTAFSFWSYSRNAAGNPTSSGVSRRYYQNGVEVLAKTSNLYGTGKEVVSSTDVAAADDGGFMFVWSWRMHALFRGTGGTINGAAPPDSYLTDAAFPDWSAENVGPGSKFHLFTSAIFIPPPPYPWGQNGFSGVVTDNNTGGLDRLHIKWEGGAAFQSDGPALEWAVTPQSMIQGVRSRNSAGTPYEPPLVGDQSIVRAYPFDIAFPTVYSIEMREPDYVRVSHGATGWCVVFQGFNSVCFPAGYVSPNFDQDHTPGVFPTSGGIPMWDKEVYRTHVSTCAVLLRDDGEVIYPNTTTIPGGFSTGPVADTGYSQFAGRTVRDVEVSLKSLGTRAPFVSRPNFQSVASASRLPFNYALEVSYHNFSYRWTVDGMQACIPDVTWTGQDWVAVSPAKKDIHSYTGVYNVNGGDSYLSDALFYFGDEGPGTINTGGWTLRKSIPTGSYLWFPSLNAGFPIASIADEHTINLVGQPFGAFGPIKNIEWVLLSPAPDAAGFKNQGFRISADGHVIASTDFVTMADQPDDLSTIPREVELMRRPQAKGGNHPTRVAGANFGLSESADPLEPGSRIKGNIGFRGVAPGRPKGTSRFMLNESPVVAIAWGENLYGLIDRTSEGTIFGSPSNIEFYRQSFGPYNVTLKNFQIDARPSNALSILSKSHVFTRHYAPVASGLSFDTDGFRNVFVYPASRVLAYGTNFPEIDYVGAVFTNAKGQDPIYMDGPALSRGYYSKWCSDMSWETLPAYVPGGSLETMRYASAGTGPKVVWDGQRFAIFWVERANSANAGATDVAVGYVVNMSYLPGGEDANLQTTEMASAYEAALSAVLQYPLASAHISDGTGFRSNLATWDEYNTVAVCDAAFSGKVYAVVWSAGMMPNYTPDWTRAKGSTLGVTLFNMDSAQASYMALNGVSRAAGGTTYVIEQFADGGAFQNPKILWDGTRFMVFFEAVLPTDTANPPATVASAVCYSIVPEDGLARPTQIKQIQAPILSTGSDYATAYPGTSGPFSATATGFGQGLGLGWAIHAVSLASPGVPNHNANYTVIQLAGAPITPAIASRVGGGITNVLEYTDAGGNFIAKGVRPGDYFLLHTGTNAPSILMIKEVTATVLAFESPGYNLNTPQAGPLSYTIYRYQQPLVQPGDHLVVTSVMKWVLSYTTSTLSNGTYPVINYDPRSHQLTVAGKFHTQDIENDGVGPTNGTYVIMGEIRSGGIADYDNASNLESTLAGVSPRSSLVANPQWASGATSLTTARLHGVAYNDVDDEFAVLVGHDDLMTTLYAFKPNVRTGTPEKVINDIWGSEFVYGPGDVAWNGSRYLVAAPFATGALGSIKAKLFNSRFGEEASVTLIPNYTSPASPNYMFGNGAGQLPGPGYGPPPPTGIGPDDYVKGPGNVYPWVVNTKVRWNARLSRWLVAASVLWYDEQPILSGENVYSDFGTFNPSFSSNIVTWAAGTTTIILSAKSKAWQPGMKVVIAWNGGAYSGLYGTALTIIRVEDSGLGSPGAGFDQLIVDATPEECPIQGVSGATLVGSVVMPVVREDVLMWTLGQDAAGLVLEDADNVMVEDVTISGGGTDIEESWPNMGRPIWQSAGQTMGNPGSTTFANVIASTPQPHYNHRFMTPAGKVNLPKYTNVTSAGRHPYGRKPQPGAAYVRDNLRNRMGS